MVNCTPSPISATFTGQTRTKTRSVRYLTFFSKGMPQLSKTFRVRVRALNWMKIWPGVYLTICNRTHKRRLVTNVGIVPVQLLWKESSNHGSRGNRSENLSPGKKNPVVFSTGSPGESGIHIIGFFNPGHKARRSWQLFRTKFTKKVSANLVILFLVANNARARTLS